MRNGIVAIMVVSAASFLWWYYTGPDRHPEALVENAGLEQVAQDQEAIIELAEAEEATDEADIMAMEAENIAAPDPAPETAAEAEEMGPAATVLTTRIDEIASLVEGAPWVHRGLTGPALYVVTFRGCSSCAAFKAAELEGLEEAGVDVRWIVFTIWDTDEGRERSSAEERAAQAELWLNRDYALFEEWYAVNPDTFYVTTQLPIWAEAEGEDERFATIGAARDLVLRLIDLYADNGVDFNTPSLLWEQDGQWVTFGGYEETSFAPVRAALVGDQ